MCCGPEAVKPQPPALTRHDQQTSADEPRAEERCSVDISAALTQTESESSVGNDVGGVPQSRV